MKKSVLALAALASATVCTPAFAAPVSASVRTADLNLASAAGRATLERRISAAAKDVCIVEGSRDLKAMIEGNKCYHDAVRAAQGKVAQLSSGIALARN